MPKCIVPGCTSGYASNPEKSHFFTVPKNPEAIELWGKAVKRKDVKHKQAVCQNHFKSEEIIWKRHLLAADGSILGVSPYKIPRLVIGVVPSIFPWVEAVEPPSESKEVPEAHTDDSLRRHVENTEKHPPAEQDDPAPPTRCQETHEENKENVNLPAETHRPQNPDVPDHQDDDTQPVDSIVKVENVISVSLIFQQLLEAEISYPPGWIVQKPATVAPTAWDSPKMIVFCTITSTKIDEVYVPHIQKAVTVMDDLSISVSAIGKQVDMWEYNFPCSITDVAELEEILYMVDALNVCKGSTGSSVDMHMSIVNCSTVHKDGTGTWRHNKCPIFISSVAICTKCRNVQKTLRTKLHRWTTGQVKQRRHIDPNSPTHKRKITRLRENLRAAKSSVLKTEKKCENLKAELRNSQVKFAHYTNLEEEMMSGNFISQPSPSPSYAASD